MSAEVPRPGEQRIRDALQPFGWTCTDDFWQRYYCDPWVFNLANAVERLTAEIALAASGYPQALTDAEECQRRAEQARDNWRSAADAALKLRDAYKLRVAELEAEVDKLNHEIMAYQVEGLYVKGHEHGTLAGLQHIRKLEAENVRLTRRAETAEAALSVAARAADEQNVMALTAEVSRLRLWLHHIATTPGLTRAECVKSARAALADDTEETT